MDPPEGNNGDAGQLNMVFLMEIIPNGVQNAEGEDLFLAFLPMNIVPVQFLPVVPPEDAVGIPEEPIEENLPHQGEDNPPPPNEGEDNPPVDAPQINGLSAEEELPPLDVRDVIQDFQYQD